MTLHPCRQRRGAKTEAFAPAICPGCAGRRGETGRDLGDDVGGGGEDWGGGDDDEGGGEGEEGRHQKGAGRSGH